MNCPSNIVATMTSRDISVLTGKQHSNVMRDIRSMIERLKADSDLNWHCESVTYADEQGKLRDMYRMDKDTTLTLVSGYDAVLRFRIIKRWQELESKPRELTREEILIMALESERERVRLSKELEAAKPMIEFHEEVSHGEGEFYVSQVAMMLFNGSVTEKQLFAWLRENSWMDKRKGINKPTAWAIKQGYMRLRVDIKNGFVFEVAKVTPQGMTILRHLHRTGELFLSGIPHERRLPAPEYRV